jgi:trans-2,3-dihydro-3-hydroxyanthranilate isomerase
MPLYRFVQCDVFTSRPLAGNALCVFTDGRGLDEGTMQRIARETNLSETVFVTPAERVEWHAAVRIFTPARELPFAGHPVIGTAAVLGHVLPFDRLTLATQAGPLEIELEREGEGLGRATMQQPEPSFSEHPDAAAVCAALGVSERPVVVGDNGITASVTEVEDVRVLEQLQPDQGALLAAGGSDTVLVYAEGDPVRVRVFCPAAGIAEDPGTGSAAGVLAAHLARPVDILQGVEIGRPSEIRAVAGDGRPPRVGGVVTAVARGQYVL